MCRDMCPHQAVALSLPGSGAQISFRLSLVTLSMTKDSAKAAGICHVCLDI